MSTSIEIRPTTSWTGAEIRGVDITQPLDVDTVTAIRDALHTWRVLFFRDQPLDHAAQVAFGTQFGPLTWSHPHETKPPEGFPQVLTVDPEERARRYGVTEAKRESRVTQAPHLVGWHADVTAAVNPPAASILRADAVPAYGGDTSFTNLVAAYESLSAPVRAFVDGLRAEHRFGGSYQGESAVYEQNPLVAHHPVVQVHPDTGERSLLVNPGFTRHILDVTPRESQWILDELFEAITRPAYQVHFHWEPGSVAFWDNRAVLHRGPVDLGQRSVTRTLHRITLIGSVPVGVDGRESEMIAGNPFREKPVFAAA